MKNASCATATPEGAAAKICKREKKESTRKIEKGKMKNTYNQQNTESEMKNVHRMRKAPWNKQNIYDQLETKRRIVIGFAT